jgi:hypothetical protein
MTRLDDIFKNWIKCYCISVHQIESYVQINGGPLTQLSAQQITSCTPNPLKCGGTGGCMVGLLSILILYLFWPIHHLKYSKNCTKPMLFFLFKKVNIFKRFNEFELIFLYVPTVYCFLYCWIFPNYLNYFETKDSPFDLRSVFSFIVSF